ncbi:MAG: NDP-sugar synthase [Clostridia bacterium]|nr:NDP-sugar synthase [Clostridia bacterium]
MVTDVIILAGGKGTRLAPLTDSLPKPLLPVGNIPTLSHILRAVEKAGLRRATITVAYQKEAIIKRYGGIFRTVKLNYATEEKPLGTAGAVKAAVLPAGYSTDQYGDRLTDEGDILVLSGDALFEGDLARFIQSHEQSGADVTIAAKYFNNVTGYGVMVGSSSRIERFVEKPSPQETPSHTVNIGIYLLSRRVLCEIPDGFYDFGKDLFPALLKKGYRLGYTLFDDYWCDIGTLESYLAANLRASDGKSVIGSHCIIPQSAHIESSVLMNHVTLGENTSVCHSIVSSTVTVKDGVTLFHNVVGEGCQITQTPSPYTILSMHEGVCKITPILSKEPLLAKT